MASALQTTSTASGLPDGDPSILTLPGYMDSGPEHWQTVWEARHETIRRVTQRDWHRPVHGEWLAELDAVLRSAAHPVVLVAHSLGCATAAHWLTARTSRTPVVAALLVAPADVDQPEWPVDIGSFRPMPTGHLGIESTVISSQDDPWIDAERARSLAGAWGSRFLDLGPAGHLGSQARLGPWPEGWRALSELLERCGYEPPSG